MYAGRELAGDLDVLENGVEERGGFEPPVLFRYSRFPGVRLKPLSHLSSEKVLVKVNHSPASRNVFP
jgi:hypothetical protein